MLEAGGLWLGSLKLLGLGGAPLCPGKKGVFVDGESVVGSPAAQAGSKSGLWKGCFILKGKRGKEKVPGIFFPLVVNVSAGARTGDSPARDGKCQRLRVVIRSLLACFPPALSPGAMLLYMNISNI